MHIPDGFLNNGVASGLFAASAVFLGAVLKNLRQSFFQKVPVAKRVLAADGAGNVDSAVRWQNKLTKLGQEKIWRMMMLGIFIFLIQMFDVPITQGNAGHLLGGVLAAIIVGPAAGFATMSLVLVSQALMLGDGGLLALGANIFNMGVIGVLGGYAIYKFVSGLLKNKKRGILAGSFAAAWASVILAALATALELNLSGVQDFRVALTATVGMHVLIGLGEAVITAAIVGWLLERGFIQKKDACS